MEARNRHPVHSFNKLAFVASFISAAAVKGFIPGDALPAYPARGPLRNADAVWVWDIVSRPAPSATKIRWAVI